jgi:hypothetical protein
MQETDMTEIRIILDPLTFIHMIHSEKGVIEIAMGIPVSLRESFLFLLCLAGLHGN